MKNWDYENDQWTKLPYHLKHLPLFTRHFDMMSQFFRMLWAIFLKFIAFRFYIRLEVVGDLKLIVKNYPRLLVISNHGSHLDATSIAAAVPYRFWSHLYIAAAKDYFFTNPLFTFFSQHCLGAIPIDRKDRKGEAVQLCRNLLTNLDQIWLIIFPEGTRSKDGHIQNFKRGVSLFSESTNTPLLFVFLDGNIDLWPKGNFFSKPGKMKLHVGPVHPPSPIGLIQTHYFDWVRTIDPTAVPTREEDVEDLEAADDEASYDEATSDGMDMEPQKDS